MHICEKSDSFGYDVPSGRCKDASTFGICTFILFKDVANDRRCRFLASRISNIRGRDVCPLQGTRQVGERVIVLAFRLTTFRMHLKTAYMYPNSIISIIGPAHLSSINCTCPNRLISSDFPQIGKKLTIELIPCDEPIDI